MPGYKLIVKNAKVFLKTVTNAVLNISGIKDLLTGDGSVDSNNKINWTLQEYTNTSANFTSINPVLLLGQKGIETDDLLTTPKFKIGDGVTAWNTLPYFSIGGSSGVQSVTGTNVDNTDPLNPIVNTQTIQQTITESSTVTGTLAQSSNTLTKKEINDNHILDTSSNGTDKSTRDLTPIAITDTVNTTAHVINDGVIENTTTSLTKNGVEIATVNDLPTIDTTIIDGSTNPVDGNAVFDALALKQDISSEQLASLTSTSISTTSSGNTDLTEMNTTVLANTTYTIDGIIRIGCNNTGGVALQVTIPSGTIFLALNGPTTNSTTAQWLNIPLSATLTGSYCRINTTTGFVYIKGIIEIGATGGDLVWGFASVVNLQTSTVYRVGTQIKITKK